VIPHEIEARQRELMKMPASEVQALLEQEEMAATSRGYEARKAARPSVMRRMANGVATLAGYNLGYAVLCLMGGIMAIWGLAGLVHVLQALRP